MARRKSKRYGEVKVKRRAGKIQRMVYQHSIPSKKVGVKVFVTRGAYAVGQGSPGYIAWACPAGHEKKGSRAKTESHSYQRRGARCGPEASGRTPTRAVESALVALARSHALRKGGR